MHNVTAAPWEIRVFLSSTFKDMQAERHYLLTRVFPEVREACESRGVGFTEIDLRWGITEQEASKGTTVAVCLNEIDRCREFPPFFIGFLGERYGWVPDQAQLDDYLAGNELDEYIDKIRAALDSNISVTELEFDYALEGQQQGRAEALFYLRSQALTDRLHGQSGAIQHSDFYDAGNGKLATLKQKLRGAGVIEIDGYDSVEAFGESVKAHLLSELNKRYPQKRTPLTLLRLPHENFARTRLKFYVPPTAACQAVETYCQLRLDLQEHRPALIIGAPGAGKSALSAHMARHLPQLASLAGATVLSFHVGADGKRSIEQWLEDLHLLLEGSVPAEQALTQVATGNEKWAALSKLLARSIARSGGRPLIVLLDGIERFDNASQVLRQLQKLHTPDKAILIMTATPSLDAGEEPVWRYPLEPMDSALLREMIDSYAVNYRKRLPDELANLLVHNPAMALPMYVRVVLEQIRIRSAHETLGDDIQTLLAHADVGSLFRSALDAWDLDLSTPGHPAVVTRAAQYLVCSRAGLSERQLALLLAGDGDEAEHEGGCKRAPQLLMSRVLSVLRPYLVRHDGREQLMHASLQTAIMQGADEAAIRRQIILLAGWASGNQNPLSSEADGSFTAPIIAERVHQACELLALVPGDSVALHTLHWDLQKPLMVVACFRAAPATLMQAFTAFCSRRAGHDQAIESITSAWQTCAPEWFPLAIEDLAVCNQITHQLIDFSHLALCEAWCGFVAELIKLRFDNLPVLLAQNNANLAALYIGMHYPEKAETLERQALAQFTAAFGPEHPEVGKALNVIALARYQLGDLAEAVRLGNQACSIQRAAYPQGNRDLVQILNNLGLAYRDLGQLEQAERTLLAAFEMAASVLDSFDIDFITLAIVLADTYCSTGDYMRAENFAAMALTESERALGRGHPIHYRALMAVGSASAGLGKPMEAIEAFEAAYAALLSTAPDDHRQLYTLECNLAQLLIKQGQLSKVQAVLHSAVDRSGHFTAEPELANISHALFEHYLSLKQAERHLATQIDHLRAMANTPAAQHDLVIQLNNQAVEFKDCGQLELSEQCFVNALELASELDDMDPANLAIVLNGLADLRSLQNRLDEAAQAFRHVLDLREARFGHNDERVAQTCYRLGSLYLEQQHLEQAEHYLARGVQTFRNSRCRDAKSIADCLNMYGILLQRTNQLEPARTHMKEAITLYRKCGREATSLITALSHAIHQINTELGDSETVAMPKWWKPWTW